MQTNDQSGTGLKHIKEAGSSLLLAGLLTGIAHLVFSGLLWRGLVWVVVWLVSILGSVFAGLSLVVVKAFDAAWWAVTHSVVVELGLLTTSSWHSYEAHLVRFFAFIFASTLVLKLQPFFSGKSLIWTLMPSMTLVLFVPIADDLGGWWRLLYVPIFVVVFIMIVGLSYTQSLNEEHDQKKVAA